VPEKPTVLGLKYSEALRKFQSPQHPHQNHLFLLLLLPVILIQNLMLKRKGKRVVLEII
jgi:hypothetical protein